MSQNTNPKVTKIVTEPYEFLIRRDIHRDKAEKYWFIQVEYKGDIIRVLYQKENINANLQERIDRLNEYRNMYLS